MSYQFTQLEPFTGNSFSSADVPDILLTATGAIHHLTGLVPDKELFPERLPLKICDAVCCSIAGERASEQPGVRCFPVKICARGSFDSCDVLNKTKSLVSSFGRPLFLQVSGTGITTPVTIQTITPKSDWKSCRKFFAGVAVPHLELEIWMYVAPEKAEQ